MFPKKVKFRKWQTDRVNPNKQRVETRGTTLAFGSHGLKSLGSARIKSNQIESARKTMTRLTKKTGKIWIRIFPDRPYTAKAAEVGMGKGKGDPQGYVFDVRPGRMLFEIDGLTAAESKEALRKAGAKLPVKTAIVSREG
ncbi:MAG TPA: 50S ribosomal protein L16 [Candidatus Vogelbacteria bacterium]|uniref:50S ribosomal protein L16 n=1 Tax=Candidatus Vogelbacteria bacterium RIFOXYD1_FULL_51_18 TaxID=1802440 RepID=A0A1G2QK07_9BACT|nr:MAG: 50S ribosomal protein L16 [Parcubacteria group bacterium GW2011_GWC1_51_35]KKW24828.1 MAG: 50S ribosomal protein L16 [Parcubacteria group bacterium GW2011_GWF2_52_12]KKW27837.1 MAG: 50S ribosomal protein L16 [Parcubacteria group bacterium GW2011_GWF1_52_5]KKW33908.1 MAG: 50S ribosomal protein L16 [Parcubacteria group bacterium GW2011_GWB1_53_43]KKW38291.1 MAG: 50S ribosomal protein L16 [Parcubacteria group bacterium GW2011_GWA1_54_88]OHA60281.1 MAG: 50S ribosomal protein L16 [Candidatu